MFFPTQKLIECQSLQNRGQEQGCRDLDKIILYSRVTSHFSILGLEKSETYFSVSILDRIYFLDLHNLVENKAIFFSN